MTITSAVSWVPEAFHAQIFKVLAAVGRTTLEKPLVPRVLLRMYVEVPGLRHTLILIRNVKPSIKVFTTRCFIMFATAVCILFLIKLKWMKNMS